MGLGVERSECTRKRMTGQETMGKRECRAKGEKKISLRFCHISSVLEGKLLTDNTLTQSSTKHKCSKYGNKPAHSLDMRSTSQLL